MAAQKKRIKKKKVTREKQTRGETRVTVPPATLAIILVLAVIGVLATVLVFTLPSKSIYDYIPGNTLTAVVINDFSELDKDFARNYFSEARDVGSAASKFAVFEHDGYGFVVLEGDVSKIRDYLKSHCESGLKEENGIISCDIGSLPGYAARVDDSHYVIGPPDVSIDWFKKFLESYPPKEHIDFSAVSDVSSMPLVVYFKSYGGRQLVGYSSDKIMAATDAGSEADAKALTVTEKSREQEMVSNPFVSRYTVSQRGQWVVTGIEGDIGGLISQGFGNYSAGNSSS